MAYTPAEETALAALGDERFTPVVAVLVELRVKAYRDGFAVGAQNGTKRHTVDPGTHADWRAGFEAGKQAVGNAADAYRTRLNEKENDNG